MTAGQNVLPYVFSSCLSLFVYDVQVQQKKTMSITCLACYKQLT